MNPLGGVYRGQVTNVSDPNHARRLRLLVPAVLGAAQTGWALPSNPRSLTIVPPVGAMVWVLFEGGSPEFPVWLDS